MGICKHAVRMYINASTIGGKKQCFDGCAKKGGVANVTVEVDKVSDYACTPNCAEREE